MSHTDTESMEVAAMEGPSTGEEVQRNHQTDEVRMMMLLPLLLLLQVVKRYISHLCLFGSDEDGWIGAVVLEKGGSHVVVPMGLSVFCSRNHNATNASCARRLSS